MSGVDHHRLLLSQRTSCIRSTWSIIYGTACSEFCSVMVPLLLPLSVWMKGPCVFIPPSVIFSPLSFLVLRFLGQTSSELINRDSPVVSLPRRDGNITLQRERLSQQSVLLKAGPASHWMLCKSQFQMEYLTSDTFRIKLLRIQTGQIVRIYLLSQLWMFSLFPDAALIKRRRANVDQSITWHDSSSYHSCDVLSWWLTFQRNEYLSFPSYTTLKMFPMSMLTQTNR